MRSKMIATALLVSAGFVARPSRADDPIPSPAVPEVQLSGTLTAGYIAFHRSASTPSHAEGIGVGGELRLHPWSRHGFFFAATEATALFGPSATIFEAGYSLRFLGGDQIGMGAAYLEVGPAAALVTIGSDYHSVVGGRASVTFDAHVGNFLLGTCLAYRGGVPTSRPPDGPPDRWENAASWLFHIGFILDVNERHTGPAVPMSSAPELDASPR